MEPAELQKLPQPREVRRKSMRCRRVVQLAVEFKVWQDLMAAEYLVNRVGRASATFKQGNAHACDDGEHASKNRLDIWSFE